MIGWIIFGMIIFGCVCYILTNNEPFQPFTDEQIKSGSRKSF